MGQSKLKPKVKKAIQIPTHSSVSKKGNILTVKQHKRDMDVNVESKEQNLQSKHDLSKLSDYEKEELAIKEPGNLELNNQLVHDSNANVRSQAYFSAPNDLLKKRMHEEKDFHSLEVIARNIDHKSLGGFIDIVKGLPKSKHYSENWIKNAMIQQVGERGDNNALKSLYENRDSLNHAGMKMTARRIDKDSLTSMLQDGTHKEGDAFVDGAIIRLGEDAVRKNGVHIEKDTRVFLKSDIEGNKLTQKYEQELKSMINDPKKLQDFFLDKKQDVPGINGQSPESQAASRAYYKVLDKISPHARNYRHEWDMTTEGNEANMLKFVASKKGWGEMNFYNNRDPETFMNKLENFLPQKDVTNLGKGLDLISAHSIGSMNRELPNQSLKIYRGTDKKEISTGTIKSNPLSSWSLSKNIAEEFNNGAILELDISRDDIAFSYFGHISADEDIESEHEVVLKGNKKRKAKLS